MSRPNAPSTLTRLELESDISKIRDLARKCRVVYGAPAIATRFEGLASELEATVENPQRAMWPGVAP